MTPTRSTCLMLSAAIVIALIVTTSLVNLASAKPPKGSGLGFTLVSLPDEWGDTNQSGYANSLHEVRDEAGSVRELEVVGILNGRAHYWALSAAGNVIDAAELPLPVEIDGEVNSNATGINDHGVIVGSAGLANAHRPYAWRGAISGAAPIELPVFDGFRGTASATGITNHGLILGWWQDEDGIEYVVAWGLTPDGTIIGPELLGLAANGWKAEANDAGDVVCTLDYQAYKWFVDWNGETLTVSAPQALTATITDAGGAVRTLPLMTATGVNEHGDVCGAYQPNGWQAYLLTAEGVLKNMPYLVDNRRLGTRNISASNLNDAPTADQITIAGRGHTYYKNSGVIERLDVTLLWRGNQAYDLQAITSQSNSQLALKDIHAVSDAGWLAGYGWTTNLDPRPVVLVPK